MFSKLKFNNNLEIPIIGLGTWKSKPGEVTQAIKDAIDIGYRHIDCAFVYGNEKEVGEAIRDKISSEVVTRKDLFITSKLWNTFHRKECVVPALKKSLNLLGLDYVDLYLIHWPMGYKEGEELFPCDENGKQLYSNFHYTETWQGMEECVKEGLTKSIGLSNFNSKQIQEILDIAKIKPVCNQVECHPYLNQEKLIKFCKSQDIVITAYSPLGSPDRPWAKPDDILLLEEPKIKQIADKYGKTPAQILLRFQVDRAVSVIPKSVNKSRIQSNFEIFDFTLSDEDLKEINSLNRDLRFLLLQQVNDHEYYPFHNDY